MNKKIFFIFLLLPISFVVYGGLSNGTIIHESLQNSAINKNQQNAILNAIQQKVKSNFETSSQMQGATCSSFSEPDNEHAYEDEALCFSDLDQTYYVPLAPVCWSMSDDKENPVTTYLARLQDKEWRIRLYVMVEYDDFMESTEQDFNEALSALLVKKQ